MTSEEQKKTASTKRFTDVLTHFADDPSAQARLQSKGLSESDFTRILQSKGITDTKTLWTARQDLFEPIPTQPQNANKPIPNSAMAGEAATAGGLAALPLALIPLPHDKTPDADKYTGKDLENAANKYADKNVSIFLRDKAKRATALEEKRQQFYDQYAIDHPDNADRISNGQNPRLRTSINKRNVALAAKLNAEAEIYAKNKDRLSKLLGKKTDHDALIQNYHNRFVKAGNKNRQIAERAFSATGNAPLLTALAADDERIRNSIRSRINNSINERLGRNISPGGTSLKPRGLRTPNLLGRARGIAGKLNPINLQSFFQRNLQKIIFSSVFSVFGASILIATFFIVFLGGGGAAGFSGSSTGAPIAGGGTPQSTYTFVALGDSLTAWPNKPAGFTLNPSCASNNSCDGAGSPWPVHLHGIDQNLIQKNPNAAIAGDTTIQKNSHPGMVNRFTTDVTNYHPDILFVLGGTNDAGNKISTTTTIANLKSIISDAQNAGIKRVILLTIPHQCSSVEYSSLNTSIKGLSSSYSPVIDISGASVLNCTKTSTDFTDFQIDRLHLTDQGAQKLAAYIDGQIKAQNLLPTQSITPKEVFYCQWSSSSYNGGGPWAKVPYSCNGSSSCTIANSGCGPTSMAIIFSSFGDKQTPDQIGKAFESVGMATNPGTYNWAGGNPKAARKWLANNNFVVYDGDLANGGRLNIAGIKKLLHGNPPYLIWATITNYTSFSNPNSHGGHYVVIADITGPDSDPTVTLYNPEYCKHGQPAQVIKAYYIDPGTNKPWNWGQANAFRPK